MGRRVVPIGDRYVAGAALTFGRLLTGSRRFEEAERLILDAERHLAAWGGPAHPRRVAAAREAVALYQSWGRPELAERYLASMPK
jgi:hypothetical protein